MGLISNIKTKLASRHSFKKNELKKMGPGKVAKAAKSTKTTKKTKKTVKGKKNVK